MYLLSQTKRLGKIDALNICWEGLDGYVFCPVAILPQVIQKIITYPCRMIVLAPGWPGMPWFWDLVDLSTRVPLQFPHWKTLLKQSHSNRFHNNVEYLNVHVWLLDSRNPNLEDSHLRWQKELRHLKGNPQSRWAIYEQWCSQNKVDITSATVPQVAEFLNYLFTVKNLKPATIAGYRTAIADALGSQGELISKSLELNRLIASFTRDRPKPNRSIPTWDLSAPLKWLTYKTVFLLALSSGKRMSEIHAWIHSYISSRRNWSEVTVSPSPAFLAKNQLASDGPDSIKPVVIPALIVIGIFINKNTYIIPTGRVPPSSPLPSSEG